MKAGPEAHFLAGQLFTLGVAAMAILPRMPSDHYHYYDVGGKLSHPFRKALLGLISVGMTRVLCFHVLLFVRPFDDGENESSNSILLGLDWIFGTIHVIGQSFLCLTTAYLLQCQLTNYINLPGGSNHPGRNLLPYLTAVGGLTLVGSIGSNLLHPNLWCLVNLAEAVSCYPVWKTLSLYTSVTSSSSGSEGTSNSTSLRGPVLTQILMVAEGWFFVTSLLSFVAEAMDDVHDDIDKAEGQFIKLLLAGVRQNQDNGIDDWTRLLLHSVFLNSLDELNHHVVPSSSSSTSTTAATVGGGTNNNNNTNEQDPSQTTAEYPTKDENLLSGPLTVSHNRMNRRTRGAV